MNREELAALGDAIDTVLSWPPAVFDEVTRWLTPEASAKPNGRDPHPTPRDGTSVHGGTKFATTEPLRQAKARRGKPPNSARAAEQRLLTALQEHSGASVNALAKAAGANRSSTGERLRGLASRGVVAKDGAGHWRLVAGEALPPTNPGGALSDPTPPPSQ